MDVTTIQCGRKTRNRLREYKDEHDYQNYDQALRNLLQHVEGQRQREDTDQ